MNKCTIVCISYNQEKYIAQALNSFVTQKTNFPFEVIISDDCSTDKTPDIIKKYAEKYPHIIKPVFKTENVGAMKNYIDTLSIAQSEYVIVNEGDDYFCDENKLQKQVDFLESHPNCSVCFHQTINKFEDKSRTDYLFPSKKRYFYKKELNLSDLLKRNFIQTNSCMYRWRFNNDTNIKDYFPKDILPGDWYLHMLHAQVGKIQMIDGAMCVYRINPNGIWYNIRKDVEKHHIKNGLKEINFYYGVYKNITNCSEKYYNNTMIPVFNEITNILARNLEYEKIKTLYENYPDLIQNYKKEKTNNNSSTIKKYNKYKKLFNIFLFTSIILLVIILILLSVFF